MEQIPPDFPNDAPLPDGRARCESEFEGKRCKRLLGHEETLKRHCRHHIGADETRWTVGPKSGVAEQVSKCKAMYQGTYRCDRWPHQGAHGAMVEYPEGKIPRRERVEWTGNGKDARRYTREVDDGYRTEGEYQAMHLGGVRW